MNAASCADASWMVDDLHCFNLLVVFTLSVCVTGRGAGAWLIPPFLSFEGPGFPAPLVPCALTIQQRRTEMMNIFWPNLKQRLNDL